MATLATRAARCLAARRYHRILGRFYRFRQFYGLVRGNWPSPRLRHPTGAFDDAAALFPGTPVEECLRSLRDDGIWCGFRLPAAELREILGFAMSALWVRPGGGVRFRLADVARGVAPDGRALAVADVCAPESCPAIRRIAADPALLDIVVRYLRYRPKNVAIRMIWSPSSGLSNAARRALGQTIDFHYDIESYSALYAYFYVTPTDRDTGAHVMVKGSHRRKPLPMKLSSCFQPWSSLRARYGESSVLTVEGPAGFGFLEAPECFHKALAPANGHRLLLQLRFS